MSRSSVLRAVGWVSWFGLAVGACLLAGCGTPFATVPAADGRPVMLLGHDPVAYFSRGQPLRGNPAWRVDLPARSYYFASAEHRALFEADPARYEPQFNQFCQAGITCINVVTNLS